MITAELAWLVIHHTAVVNWVSHNLWVVFLPFLKVVLKKLATSKLLSLAKSLLVLGWHLLKLFFLKLFKTLFLRYGIFFSQHRWYWIRRAKVMFLRRGRQFFRGLKRFWAGYDRPRKAVILVAFFPVVIVLAFLAFSFNITRKTMVQRTQESAIFSAAATAGKRSAGIRAWLADLDTLTLQKIRAITLRNRAIRQKITRIAEVQGDQESGGQESGDRA